MARDEPELVYDRGAGGPERGGDARRAEAVQAEAQHHVHVGREPIEARGRFVERVLAKARAEQIVDERAGRRPGRALGLGGLVERSRAERLPCDERQEDHEAVPAPRPQGAELIAAQVRVDALRDEGHVVRRMRVVEHAQAHRADHAAESPLERGECVLVPPRTRLGETAVIHVLEWRWQSHANAMMPTLATRGQRTTGSRHTIVVTRCPVEVLRNRWEIRRLRLTVMPQIA